MGAVRWGAPLARSAIGPLPIGLPIELPIELPIIAGTWAGPAWVVGLGFKMLLGWGGGVGGYIYFPVNRIILFYTLFLPDKKPEAPTGFNAKLLYTMYNIILSYYYTITPYYYNIII